MKVSMIAAMGEKRVIGLDNKMPWHLPADLAFFKRMTLNKPVVMGRNTFESIGRPLPKRQNIVMTRSDTWNHPEVTCANSIDDVYRSLPSICDEVMIIGGAKIYKQWLPQVDRLYLTFIKQSFQGDTYFPDFISEAEWQEVHVESYLPDAKNPFPYQFVVLERC